ncbi:MAG: type II toxin-antitoxin system RelE/ParE family toxin [Bacteroidales bacterium]|nr:type II toxin-antitoxin system RelE/ParE family toxin [Bacteroidales bacterium]
MVRRKIKWSNDAKNDLFNILDFYIERNRSKTYSIKLNQEINKSIQQIVRNPNLGIRTDFDSVRSLITSDYQIIYEVFEQLNNLFWL